MITTLKITLIRGRYCEDEWTANIELDESSALIELHDAIQQAVKFDNDHGFCFFVARTERSRHQEDFDDENGLVFTKTIGEMFPLPSKQSLFYLFDWGDSWIFKVSATRKRLKEPATGVSYPRVDSELGTKPVQYPPYDEDE